MFRILLWLGHHVSQAWLFECKTLLKFNLIQVVFALKLGYEEELTRKALRNIGPTACNVRQKYNFDPLF